MKQKRIRIAVDVDRELLARIDADRKGKCSRAVIVRMALYDRYRPQAQDHKKR